MQASIILNRNKFSTETSFFFKNLRLSWKLLVGRYEKHLQIHLPKDFYVGSDVLISYMILLIMIWCW